MSAWWRPPGSISIATCVSQKDGWRSPTGVCSATPRLPPTGRRRRRTASMPGCSTTRVVSTSASVAASAGSSSPAPARCSPAGCSRRRRPSRSTCSRMPLTSATPAGRPPLHAANRCRAAPLCSTPSPPRMPLRHPTPPTHASLEPRSMTRLPSRMPRHRGGRSSASWRSRGRMRGWRCSGVACRWRARWRPSSPPT